MAEQAGKRGTVVINVSRAEAIYIDAKGCKQPGTDAAHDAALKTTDWHRGNCIGMSIDTACDRPWKATSGSINAANAYWIMKGMPPKHEVNDVPLEFQATSPYRDWAAGMSERDTVFDELTNLLLLEGWGKIYIPEKIIRRLLEVPGAELLAKERSSRQLALAPTVDMTFEHLPINTAEKGDDSGSETLDQFYDKVRLKPKEDASKVEATKEDRVKNMKIMKQLTEMVVHSDFYEIFGYERYESDISAEEVQRRFRILSKHVHPDKNNDPDATCAFRILNEGRVILQCADLRSRYAEELSKKRTERLRRPAKHGWRWAFIGLEVLAGIGLLVAAGATACVTGGLGLTLSVAGSAMLFAAIKGGKGQYNDPDQKLGDFFIDNGVGVLQGAAGGLLCGGFGALAAGASPLAHVGYAAATGAATNVVTKAIDDVTDLRTRSHTLFLPMAVLGEVVLKQEGDRNWRVCMPNLENIRGTPGLDYRRCKLMDEDQKTSDCAKWGEVIEGVDTGDGWLEVTDARVIEFSAKTVYGPNGIVSWENAGRYVCRSATGALAGAACAGVSQLCDGYFAANCSDDAARLTSKPIGRLAVKAMSSSGAGSLVRTGSAAVETKLRTGTIDAKSVLTSVSVGALFSAAASTITVAAELTHEHFAQLEDTIEHEAGQETLQKQEHPNIEILHRMDQMSFAESKLHDMETHAVLNKLDEDMQRAHVLVPSTFLPMKLNGDKVLKYAPEDKEWVVSKPRRVENGAKGLNYRRSKQLNDVLDEVAEWGAVVEGIDNHDGWLQVVSPTSWNH
jgi:hypothetical protein